MFERYLGKTVENKGENGDLAKFSYLGWENDGMSAEQTGILYSNKVKYSCLKVPSHFIKLLSAYLTLAAKSCPPL